VIDAMPRPRLPNLRREKTRHGQIIWYYQEGHGPRTRLRAVFGTPEFRAQYDAAAKGEQPSGLKVQSKSLAWLAARYMESGAWAALSIGTRKQRGNVIKRVLEKAGHEPYSAITKKAMQQGLDRRKDTPDAARHFLLTFRHMFRWAVTSEYIEADPTDGIKVPRSKTDGFKVWPEEWCLKFEARWPIGTHERVWYEVIYCTGLRRSDAVRVGRPHVKNGRGMIRAEKNGETAYFVVSDRLQAALDAGPVGDLTWIVGKSGKPITRESFGNFFRDACAAAGVPGSAHGIRKTRATIVAESGASGAKLDALFGWKTGSNTSAIYIRSANRAKLAFGS
jgi:site-specific recombinase XerD